MDIEDVVTTVSGRPITVREVVTYLKSNGTFRNAVYDLIGREVVRQQCEEYGIDVLPGEFDAYAEARRLELGLSDSVAMANYCRWLGISLEQWLQDIEVELLKLKLADRVVTPDTVEDYLEDNRAALRPVALSRLVCRTREDIEAARRMIVEDGREFCSVARHLSVEESTRMAGGYMGTVSAGMLPAEVDAAVFSAREPGMLGPFRENEHWTLYEVQRISALDADEQMLKQIKAQLFSNWLNEQVRTARA
jgi:hypothetical protein